MVKKISHSEHLKTIHLFSYKNLFIFLLIELSSDILLANKLSKTYQEDNMIFTLEILEI